MVTRQYLAQLITVDYKNTLKTPYLQWFSAIVEKSRKRLIIVIFGLKIQLVFKCQCRFEPGPRYKPDIRNGIGFFYVWIFHSIRRARSISWAESKEAPARSTSLDFILKSGLFLLTISYQTMGEKPVSPKGNEPCVVCRTNRTADPRYRPWF